MKFLEIPSHPQDCFLSSSSALFFIFLFYFIPHPSLSLSLSLQNPTFKVRMSACAWPQLSVVTLCV